MSAEGDFTLNDLCGGAGRLDVLLRCVSSAFFLSHDIRREVEVLLVLPGRGGPKTVRFSGGELRYLNPDERSTAALVRTALLKRLEGDGERPSTPGVRVSRRGLAEALASLPGPVWLAEDGEPWPEGGLPPESTFYLSDHHDFTDPERELLSRAGARKVSLGPVSLHSNHCITIVHHLQDSGGSGASRPEGTSRR